MTILRRNFLASPFLASAAKSQSSRAKRPNVLLIMTDDQGYGDNAFNGNPILRTPSLDKLARESVRLSRFYVSPLCAPTRASLLTGRYHLRTGVWGVTGGRETMRTDEMTIAEALRVPFCRKVRSLKRHHVGKPFLSRTSKRGARSVSE